MKLILDENISGSVIRALRQRGHNIIAVKETMRSQSDEAILHAAQQEKRLVVTYDKDFGELAFRMKLPAECGIILLRLTGDSPEEDNIRIIEVIESGLDFTGSFCVVTEERIRMRPLPIRPA